MAGNVRGKCPNEMATPSVDSAGGYSGFDHSGDVREDASQLEQLINIDNIHGSTS